VEITPALRDQLIRVFHLPSNDEMADDYGPGKAAVYPTASVETKTNPYNNRPYQVYTAEAMFSTYPIVGLVEFQIGEDGDVCQPQIVGDTHDDPQHFEDGWSYDDLVTDETHPDDL
jgi:hypothetical protein